MKKLFPVLLFMISLTVAVGLMYLMNMWKYIVLYWVTLTVKNGFDIWSKR